MSYLNERKPKTRLNVQWSLDGWAADCPHCGAAQVLEFEQGVELYTCPACGQHTTGQEFTQFMAMPDYFNNMGFKNHLLKLARDEYQTQGRGVLVLDFGADWPNDKPQVYYLAARQIEESIGWWPAPQVEEWVYTYTPAYEAIVYLLHNDGSLDPWQRLWAAQPLKPPKK